MKPRHQRLILIGGALAALGGACALILAAFEDNLVFFFTPTQVAAGEAPRAGQFRIGGMVEQGSVQRQGDTLAVAFTVTDHVKKIRVHYSGALPDLFKEGKGVVAQGRLEQGSFMASEVLAKHDENYMPPEAAHALEQGRRANAAPQPQGAQP
jgi:cytochrome c-type biogenesis protein CcmE